MVAGSSLWTMNAKKLHYRHKNRCGDKPNTAHYTLRCTAAAMKTAAGLSDGLPYWSRSNGFPNSPVNSYHPPPAAQKETYSKKHQWRHCPFILFRLMGTAVPLYKDKIRTVLPKKHQKPACQIQIKL